MLPKSTETVQPVHNSQAATSPNVANGLSGDVLLRGPLSAEEIAQRKARRAVDLGGMSVFGVANLVDAPYPPTSPDRPKPSNP